MLSRTKFILLLSGFTAISWHSLPVLAKSIEFQGLPIKPQEEISARKIHRSQMLADWVVKTLESQHATVGIISRLGQPSAKLFDETGMTHSGYVFRNPQTNQWITYSLYADPETDKKTSRVWQQSVFSFYYGQSGKRTDALIFIPSKDLQDKLYARLTAQPFDLLLPKGQRYNLVAAIQSPVSFNCNKWILLQYFSARDNTLDRNQILKTMWQEYRELPRKPSWLVRTILKRKPDVNWDELNPPNQIQTVTVGGLTHSGLFEKQFMYHDR